MICRKIKASLPDLLLAPELVSAEVHAHVKSCAECGRELREMQAAMAVLDDWQTPDEISPYFDARMAALLREEKEAAPAGWLERMRARLMFGDKANLRPLLAAALALMVAVGGGMYAGFSTHAPQPVQLSSPVLQDLQSLDENAQVFQELNSMDQQDAGDNGAAGAKSL